MTEEKINRIKQSINIEPHKLFPDNPAPYSHVWEMVNDIGELYIVNWDTQTIEHTPEKYPDLKQCYKMTEVKLQKNPLSPGLYVKVDHEDADFGLLDHCQSIKIDGKEYVPFYKIEPTPGRELPPLDNPDAEWTGTKADGHYDMTNQELDLFMRNEYVASEKKYFEQKSRKIDILNALSEEQINAIANQEPGSEKILDKCISYICGRIDNLDFLSEETEIDEYDFDPTDD